MGFSIADIHINWVDFLILIALVVGIVHGRRRGMSEELLDVIKWTLILLVGAYAYEPAGQLLAQITCFSTLFCYVAVYSLVIVVFLALFSFFRRDKLVGSDFFGAGEYYLGMMAGLYRYVCIILVLFALLNARHYSPGEIQREDTYQESNFGSIRFPTPISLQTAIMADSLTGSSARNYLSFLLIRPTFPEEKGLGGHSVVRSREQMVDDIMKK